MNHLWTRFGLFSALLEAPKIIKGLKNAEVVEGGRIALEVEVTGKPKTVKWYSSTIVHLKAQNFSVE